MDQTAFTDSRVTKTINRIHDGMVNLLKMKAYNDITVKDICEKSQISRTTFIHITKLKMILYTAILIHC